MKVRNAFLMIFQMILFSPSKNVEPFRAANLTTREDEAAIPQHIFFLTSFHDLNL